MRKLIYILLCISFSCDIGFSQTKKIDSLTKLILRHQKNDTIRVNALNNLAQSYQNVDLEKAKSYTEEAEKISTLINYPYGTANSYYNLGFYYWNIGEYDTSIVICKKALSIFKSIKNIEGQVRCYNRISVNYHLTGRYEESINNYSICLDLCKEAGYEKEMGKIYNNLGIVYGFLNDYEKALEYNYKALKIKESLKDTFSIGITLGNLGYFNLKIKNFNEAYKYLKLSLNYNIKINNNYILGETYQELGNLYDYWGKFDSAYIFHEKGLEYVTNFGNQGNIGRSYYLLGNHYLLRGNYNKAIEFGHKAIKIAPDDKDNLLNSLDLLHQAYSEKEDFKKAYKYLEDYKQLNEELNKNQNLKRLAVKEVELELISHKEKSNLEIENYKKQRLLTFAAFIFSFVAVLLISYILFLKSKKNARLRKANQTRDQMLKIISHDFRSPLISISNTLQLLPELIKEKDYDAAIRLSEKDEQSVTRVLSLIDSLIGWTLSQNDDIPYNPQNYNLHEISSFLFDLYTPIANYKNIELTNQIPQNTQVFCDKNILNTVLRNLINNAIKFTPNNGKIQVNAELNNENLVLSVKDNGIGIAKENLIKIFDVSKNKTEGTKGEKGNGLGLFFCKEFVQKNKGDIWVKSEVDKGTNVFFTVPAVHKSI